MDKITSHEALTSAIAKFTTLKAFSVALGVKYQVVQQWLVNGVPAEYCPEIEKLTEIRCEDLNDKVDWAFLRTSAQSASPKNSNTRLPLKPGESNRRRASDRRSDKSDPKASV